MSSPHRRRTAAATVAALVALTTGCTVVTEDDELTSPRRTVTTSPSATSTPTVLPGSVPVGDGPVSERDVVWSQGSRLHVGSRSVDLSPLRIDAFVVVPGGVYLLDRGELWFTDLSRVRATGLTGLTDLELAADGTRVRVTSADGATAGAAAYVFDVGTGRRVEAEDFEPAAESDRLGRPVSLRVPGTGELRGRRGPGRYAVGLGERSTPVAVDTVTGAQVRWRGAVPEDFALAGWAGPGTFYGTSGDARAGSVVSCEVPRRACTVLGRATGTVPVRFGTGS